MLFLEIAVFFFAVVLVVIFALVCNPPTALVNKLEKKSKRS